MIQVITTIELRPDCMDRFLVYLGGKVPGVKAERGCLAYEPMVDDDSGLPIQGELRQNTVTLVEAWANPDALLAHLKAPHMASFREGAKDYVQSISYRVLRTV